ncbi:MAG: hypothetical protein AAGC53_05345 [Actinomycetota bacterium]
MPETSVNSDRLLRFAEEVRGSTGWLQTECGIPCSSAVMAASSATTWPDGSLHFFGVRWDQEIQMVSDALANFTRGLADVVEVYETTDESLS